jgi:hypothetical protein
MERFHYEINQTSFQTVSYNCLFALASNHNYTRLGELRDSFQPPSGLHVIIVTLVGHIFSTYYSHWKSKAFSARLRAHEFMERGAGGTLQGNLNLH